MRDSHPLALMQLHKDGAVDTGDVTCCTYSDTGMHLAVGTDAGAVQIFDIRSHRPLLERDHMNGARIHSLSFHRGGESTDSRLLLGSADLRSVKVWDASSGDLTATIESDVSLNCLTFVPNSGLFFCAREQPRIGVYFSPALGLAPRWCAHLDSLTEELEESKSKSAFDNYQFVTTEQIAELGATELIGSKFLRPYMHGFFMTSKLHAKLKLDSNPFGYEEYQKKRVREKLDAKRTMRSRVKKVLVNKDLHERLAGLGDKGEKQGASSKQKGAAERAEGLLADDRFAPIFADPDFAIDDETEANAAKVPQKLKAKRKAPGF
eukprot:NODE_10222_length_1367_cov_12.927419.p1 GENE.NODE_10222_length_1367_cov_12.927419~~NODE_10222_length_1367_cov_12.927419.p1  ORF type:complete len:321 (+),score=43.58 NODE_10222_length_1367_cov_12.927419:285-1247(+)